MTDFDKKDKVVKEAYEKALLIHKELKDIFEGDTDKANILMYHTKVVDALAKKRVTQITDADETN